MSATQMNTMQYLGSRFIIGLMSALALALLLVAGFGVSESISQGLYQGVNSGIFLGILSLFLSIPVATLGFPVLSLASKSLDRWVRLLIYIFAMISITVYLDISEIGFGIAIAPALGALIFWIIEEAKYTEQKLPNSIAEILGSKLVTGFITALAMTFLAAIARLAVIFWQDLYIYEFHHDYIINPLIINLIFTNFLLFFVAFALNKSPRVINLSIYIGIACTVGLAFNSADIIMPESFESIDDDIYTSPPSSTPKEEIALFAYYIMSAPLFWALEQKLRPVTAKD